MYSVGLVYTILIKACEHVLSDTSQLFVDGTISLLQLANCTISQLLAHEYIFIVHILASRWVEEYEEQYDIFCKLRSHAFSTYASGEGVRKSVKMRTKMRR